MVQKVRMPDGTIVGFPDDMPRDQIRALIETKFPELARGAIASETPGKAGGAMAAQAPENPVKDTSGAWNAGINNTMRPFIAGAGDMATFGFGDEISAGVDTVVDGAGALIQHAMGQPAEFQDPATAYNENLQRRRQYAEDAQRLNPTAYTIGQIGGLFANPAATESLVGKVPWLAKPVVGAAEGAVQGGIYGAGSGETMDERLANAGEGAKWGATLGAVAPVVIGGTTLAASTLARRASTAANTIAAPTKEALRRLGLAMQRDTKANPATLASAADEAVATQTGVPLINADRGGETVRALTRSVANQSPEARGVIEKTASDRFAGQGERAAQFVQRLAGGNVDDLAAQAGLRDAAKRVNDPAYRAAENAPAAQSVWNADLANLMGSPRFLNAVRNAESRGADRAVIEGFKPVQNPFVVAGGNVTLKPGAMPNLRFWDQVKRNLDGMIEAATSGAKPDRTLVSDLTQLKQRLVGILDNIVPEYRQARQGAAAFFGAEDALEAGRNFATKPRMVPEARQAFSALSKPEQQLFGIGYASELIDRIKAAGDRTNVINQMFKNQASREMMELVFGGAKARELEAYVRVEDIADRLRGAMGNSTTARQLAELGLGAGVGGYLGNWDPKSVVMGAVAIPTLRFAGRKLEERVLVELGRLLTSSDPALLQRAVEQAASSNEWMDALRRLGEKLDTASRRGATAEAGADEARSRPRSNALTGDYVRGKASTGTVTLRQLMEGGML